MTRAESRQLTFVFADSPQGGEQVKTSDVSDAKTWLLHRADGKATNDSAAQADAGQPTARLLERVACESNMARALLHVARNKGAAGVDGRSIDEVVEASPTLLLKLRRELLAGSYRPGDIRRVWIPKPGGKGQRGLGIPTASANYTTVQ